MPLRVGGDGRAPVVRPALSERARPAPGTVVERGGDLDVEVPLAERLPRQIDHALRVGRGDDVEVGPGRVGDADGFGPAPLPARGGDGRRVAARIDVPVAVD